MQRIDLTYDQPSVWAPLLVEWAEQKAADYTGCANDLRRDGCQKNAADHDAVAAEYRAISFRACQRLLVAADNKRAEISAVTAQINDEPPMTLLALPGWLMRRMHGWLPWVRPETWQSFAAMVLADRERRP